MTFSYSVIDIIPFGNMRLAFGTFTDEDTNGNDVVTGLNQCFVPFAQNATDTNEADVALSATLGTITITCNTANDDGYWMAIGI